MILYFTFFTMCRVCSNFKCVVCVIVALDTFIWSCCSDSEWAQCGLWGTVAKRAPLGIGSKWTEDRVSSTNLIPTLVIDPTCWDSFWDTVGGWSSASVGDVGRLCLVVDFWVSSQFCNPGWPTYLPDINPTPWSASTFYHGFPGPHRDLIVIGQPSSNLKILPPVFSQNPT